MASNIDKAGLQVDERLARFIAHGGQGRCAQNAGDPLYHPLEGHSATSLAYQAARAGG